ncbi:hypothetical protein Cgig2_007566 [Carnegiea gigantea]|uniref:Reverse transcriptase zinc-binding domain-containing protein n=1 Tax=Carnegiea gigantea TaxID=171969 RepID=A0A9Q1JJ08_9CARY|nr:hypothetical protein Cgig2_007566 [Carnegiea gigantea]
MYRIEAQGFRGGIWLFWKTNSVDLHLVKSSTQFITMDVNPGSTRPWSLTIIYASPHETLRQSLWANLSEYGRTCNKPWLLAGDLNKTRSMEERFNCSDDLARWCNNFNLWIENNHLIELGFSGPRYTWTRGNTVETRKYVRLDHGLCNEHWRMLFEEASVRHLLQNKSNHNPLLISLHGFTPVQASMRPFRFQAAWLAHSSFKDFLQDNWNPQDLLYPSLFRLSVALEEWNKLVFGNLFRRRREIWARLEGIQKRLSPEQNRFLLQLEKSLRHDLDEVLDQIETFWFQKSRTEAIQDGDRNTRFYHLSFEVSPGDDNDDQLVWDSTTHGSFSIRSAVALIRNDIQDTSNPGWELIWRAPLPQKMRFFLWLARHDRLMTNSNRFIRGLTDDPRCKGCLNGEEHTVHLLRDCKLAREIWTHLVPHARQIAFFNLPLKDWMSSNLVNGSLSDRNWATIFATATWWLWKCRNRRCFENPELHQPEAWVFIQARAREIINAFNAPSLPSSVASKQRIQEAFVHWHALREDWIKLNIDGASRGNPRPAGGGGIFRDHYGNSIRAFACNFGWCTSVKAEALALLKGLRIAWDMGYKKLEITLDSQITAWKSRQPCPRNQPLYFHHKGV